MFGGTSLGSIVWGGGGEAGLLHTPRGNPWAERAGGGRGEWAERGADGWSWRDTAVPSCVPSHRCLAPLGVFPHTQGCHENDVG